MINSIPFDIRIWWTEPTSRSSSGGSDLGMMRAFMEGRLAEMGIHRGSNATMRICGSDTGVVAGTDQDQAFWDAALQSRLFRFQPSIDPYRQRQIAYVRYHLRYTIATGKWQVPCMVRWDGVFQSIHRVLFITFQRPIWLGSYLQKASISLGVLHSTIIARLRREDPCGHLSRLSCLHIPAYRSVHG